MNDIGHAADAARDDRQSPLHRIEQNAAYAFAIRRQNEDIESREIIADILDEARELEIAEARRRGFEHRFILAAADQHEVNVGIGARKLASDGDDELLAFLAVVEGADMANDELARQARANRGAVRRVDRQ